MRCGACILLAAYSPRTARAANAWTDRPYDLYTTDTWATTRGPEAFLGDNWPTTPGRRAFLGYTPDDGWGDWGGSDSEPSSPSERIVEPTVVPVPLTPSAAFDAVAPHAGGPQESSSTAAGGAGGPQFFSLSSTYEDLGSRASQDGGATATSPRALDDDDFSVLSDEELEAAKPPHVDWWWVKERGVHTHQDTQDRHRDDNNSTTVGTGSAASGDGRSPSSVPPSPTGQELLRVPSKPSASSASPDSMELVGEEFGESDSSSQVGVDLRSPWLDVPASIFTDNDVGAGTGAAAETDDAGSGAARRICSPLRLPPGECDVPLDAPAFGSTSETFQDATSDLARGIESDLAHGIEELDLEAGLGGSSSPQQRGVRAFGFYSGEALQRAVMMSDSVQPPNLPPGGSDTDNTTPAAANAANTTRGDLADSDSDGYGDWVRAETTTSFPGDEAARHDGAGDRSESVSSEQGTMTSSPVARGTTTDNTAASGFARSSVRAQPVGELRATTPAASTFPTRRPLERDADLFRLRGLRSILDDDETEHDLKPPSEVLRDRHALHRRWLARAILSRQVFGPQIALQLMEKPERSEILKSVRKGERVKFPISKLAKVYGQLLALAEGEVSGASDTTAGEDAAAATAPASSTGTLKMSSSSTSSTSTSSSSASSSSASSTSTASSGSLPSSGKLSTQEAEELEGYHRLMQVDIRRTHLLKISADGAEGPLSSSTEDLLRLAGALPRKAADAAKKKAPLSGADMHHLTEAEEITVGNVLSAFMHLPANPVPYTQGMTFFLHALLLSIRFKEEEAYFWLLLYFLNQKRVQVNTDQNFASEGSVSSASGGPDLIVVDQKWVIRDSQLSPFVAPQGRSSSTGKSEGSPHQTAVGRVPAAENSLANAQSETGNSHQLRQDTVPAGQVTFQQFGLNLRFLFSIPFEQVRNMFYAGLVFAFPSLHTLKLVKLFNNPKSSAYVINVRKVFLASLSTDDAEQSIELEQVQERHKLFVETLYLGASNWEIGGADSSVADQLNIVLAKTFFSAFTQILPASVCRMVYDQAVVDGRYERAFLAGVVTVFNLLYVRTVLFPNQEGHGPRAPAVDPEAARSELLDVLRDPFPFLADTRLHTWRAAFEQAVADLADGFGDDFARFRHPPVVVDETTWDVVGIDVRALLRKFKGLPEASGFSPVAAAASSLLGFGKTVVSRGFGLLQGSGANALVAA